MKKTRKILLFLIIVCVAKIFPLTDFKSDIVADAYKVRCLYRTKNKDLPIKEFMVDIDSEQIGNTFFYSSAYHHIFIPHGITSLGDECFSLSFNLIDIVLPSSVTHLGNCCFEGCEFLTKIEIQNGVTHLGEYCFAKCPNLTSIAIPHGVTYVPGNCFYGCSGLFDVTIPNSVAVLGKRCFCECSALSSIKIPNSVSAILTECFMGCRELKDVTISSGINVLEKSCFKECPQDMRITLLRNEKSRAFEQDLLNLGFNNTAIYDTSFSFAQDNALFTLDSNSFCQYCSQKEIEIDQLENEKALLKSQLENLQQLYNKQLQQKDKLLVQKTDFEKRYNELLAKKLPEKQPTDPQFSKSFVQQEKEDPITAKLRQKKEAQYNKNATSESVRLKKTNNK